MLAYTKARLCISHELEKLYKNGGTYKRWALQCGWNENIVIKCRHFQKLCSDKPKRLINCKTMGAFKNDKLCHADVMKISKNNGGISKREALPYEWNKNNLLKRWHLQKQGFAFCISWKNYIKMGALTNGKICNADEMKIL